MKKRTLLKAAGLITVVAAAGAIAHRAHQTDKKMVGFKKRFKYTSECVVYDTEFEADSIAAVCSGLEIDFTETTLKDGHGKLSLFAEMSGIDIVIPEDWHVVATGINNKSGVNNAFAGGEEADDKPVLTIEYDVHLCGLNIRKPDEEECC
jgi:hypothetical protein